MRIRITTRPTTTQQPNETIALAPLKVTVKHRPMRVLDFDCEARPLHWIASDYVSKEITAIAWAWTDDPAHVSCVLLGDTDPVSMLEQFRAAYDQADLVTGHFIRGYDLPMINGAMTEYQRPALGDKLSHDTKIDLLRRAGLSSSQENLGAMLHLAHGKVKMDQRTWREANRLTPDGLAAARERVIGDVQQHIEMRRRLLELGYLGPPVLWKSKSAPPVDYTP